MDRPALQRLLADLTTGRVDTVVVYKIDRLTRSLADFAKIVEILDTRGASFVSVTQQFNTTTSMGRLTLNVLLSFAQFEREVIGERIRDKIAASKKKGMWMGGVPPLGYRAQDRKLVIVDSEAEIVRFIFRRYAELGSADQSPGPAELPLPPRTRRAGDRPQGHAHPLLTNRPQNGGLTHAAACQSEIRTRPAAARPILVASPPQTHRLAIQIAVARPAGAPSKAVRRDDMCDCVSRNRP